MTPDPDTFTATGGARAGFINWSWPCARLEVTASTLRLTITFFARVAEYTFRPEEVIAITPHGSIPFFGTGLRITHSKREYPATIIFWCLGGRDKALSAIAATGFHGVADAGQSPHPAGFPFRPGFWISAMLIWNGLFFMDVFESHRFEPLFGPNIPAALVLAAATCFAVLKFPRAQRIALKPEHTVAEVRPLLTMIGLISAASLPLFIFFWLNQR